MASAAHFATALKPTGEPTAGPLVRAADGQFKMGGKGDV